MRANPFRPARDQLCRGHVWTDPQIVERGLRIDVPDGDGVMVPSVRTPIVFSESTLKLDRASPRLGEHTDEVVNG